LVRRLWPLALMESASNFRSSFSAACLFRRFWTSTSSTSPSSSTARHRYIRRPRIRTTISSKRHRPVGDDRRRRRLAAINGPNFITQQRTASRLASIPRCASSSSTSRMLSVKRKY
jgi:hypothetical protein